MTGAIGGLEDGISNTGEAALKTGDIIKANLVSEAVTQGMSKAIRRTSTKRIPLPAMFPR